MPSTIQPAKNNAIDVLLKPDGDLQCWAEGIEEVVIKDVSSYELQLDVRSLDM
jgi:hypothetical protein